MEDDTKVWHLHGARYDLTPFLDKHPGGRSILMATQGLQDATPLFESYHAFANRDYIRKTLEQYRLVGPGRKPLYRYDGLFDKFVQRARAKFGAKGESHSVTNRIKANTWWWLKIIIETIVFYALWTLTFIMPPSYSPMSRLACGFLTGLVFISLGFNTMHDASHFAIQARNGWANKFFLGAWTAWALWSSSYWMTHHVVRHHGFTGHPELDPDTQHARPFIRKNLESPRSKYLAIPSWMNKLWQFALLSFVVFGLFPGMFMGQVFSYALIWPMRRYLWKMPHPGKGSFDRGSWEVALSIISAVSHLIFAPSLYATAGFFTGCNIAYAICILPDHDAFESAVENHIEISDECVDWGEVQVRHSCDFGDGIHGRVYGEIAGGINYQCVHHLIPGVSHVHFPELTEILEQTCKEMGIPYTRHANLSSALWSVAKTFMLTMQPTNPPQSDDNPENANRRTAGCREYNTVTGMLFGAWFTLCTLVVLREGRHLLAVPSALLIALAVYQMNGAFRVPLMKRDAARAVQSKRLLQSSFYLSSVLTLGTLTFLMGMTGSKHYILIWSLISLGLVAGELFALVLSSTFKLNFTRVIANTGELIVLSILALRGYNGVWPMQVLILEHWLGLLHDYHFPSILIRPCQILLFVLALNLTVMDGTWSSASVY